MSIVRFDRSYKVCATCSSWKGNRQVENGYIVFNNRDTGICCGIAFKDWSMGSTSTCLEWQQHVEDKKVAAADIFSVNKMTQVPPA